MTAGILILLVFIAAAVSMFLRKLPALLAVPLMAIAIGLVEVITGKLSFQDVLLVVVADGSQRLIEPIIISILSGAVSLLMQKSGVAESLIKTGAELAGSNPFVVSLVVFAVVGLLFTTIGGLGAVIMVATIVLPILGSVGLREQAAGGILLLGISFGGLLNVNNWAAYKTVLSISPERISSYALILFLIQIPIAVLFIGYELWRARSLHIRVSKIVISFLLLGAAALAIWVSSPVWSRITPEGFHATLEWMTGVFGGAALLFIVIDKIRAFRTRDEDAVRWYSYLIPVVPLILVLVYQVHFVSSFVLAFFYGIIATLRKRSIQLATRSVIDGGASVIPVIILMLGIGMLLSAILGPTKFGAGAAWYEKTAGLAAANGGAANGPTAWPVLADMRPLLESVVPTSFWNYVFGFALLAPLALYRGPMNVWGLGYGVAGVLLSTGQLPAAAIMGILMSLSIVQGICDPTNTHNVWLANELRVDVNALMWRTLPYAWLAAFFGLLAAAIKFL